MDDTFYVHSGDRTIYTTVTANSDTIADWINDVTTFFRNKRTVIFGLDIEWRPSWGRSSENPVATLQICAGNRCLIIQLIHLHRTPRLLDQFLANPRYLFAGVEIAGDARQLEADYDLICENLYDLRKEALDKRPERLTRCPGLKELANVVAGVHLEKPKRVSTSNWDLECLRPEQVEYACLDAYASCRIGVVLLFGYQWAPYNPPPTCAYIEFQQLSDSSESSDYEEYGEHSDYTESSDYEDLSD